MFVALRIEAVDLGGSGVVCSKTLGVEVGVWGSGFGVITVCEGQFCRGYPGLCIVAAS